MRLQPWKARNSGFIRRVVDLMELLQQPPRVVEFGILGERIGYVRSNWRPVEGDLRRGLEELKVHELRHTFVALWVDAGENLKSVSVRAGHSSVAFTLDRYGHLYDDRDPDIQDRLDTLLDARWFEPIR